jgi:glycerol kinase
MYILSIDQGTTSSRAILFDLEGVPVAHSQKEHKQYYPKPGWVEHDPEEIWKAVCKTIQEVLKKTQTSPDQVKAIGITNQRETTVLWNKKTGKAVHKAIVWQDTRTSSLIESHKTEGGIDKYRAKTGLPLATYFSAGKLEWLFNEYPELAKQADELAFGTIDCYLLWRLSGGKVHKTDVTNASRTLLMNLETLDWDADLLRAFHVPKAILPEIVPSIPEEPYGHTDPNGFLGASIPLAGILGDQQAALFGQACFEPGESKNTYGTGCFLLMNTGTEPVHSKKGLLTTLGYQIGKQKPVYALEGSIAIAGSLVQWLRDNLGIISSSEQVESLALESDDNGDVYIVPAFSGLFAPYWRNDARGVITGLTGFANKSHIARAVLESVAYQTQDIFSAMEADSGITLKTLKVDGGMTVNNTLMQFQADMVRVPVVRPKIPETTALGAAYAAGLCVGFWKSTDELRGQWKEIKRFSPVMDMKKREKYYSQWQKAVKRTLSWVD